MGQDYGYNYDRRSKDNFLNGVSGIPTNIVHIHNNMKSTIRKYISSRNDAINAIKNTCSLFHIYELDDKLIDDELNDILNSDLAAKKLFEYYSK